MKRTVGVILAALAAALIFSCASLGGARVPPVSGLLSLDEALAEITAVVEARVEQGTGVGVTKIDAPLPVIGDFLYEELLGSLGSGGKLVVLARGKDMEALNTEHQFQASGLVSDASAVGIGHYLGAKAMITCSFSRFANFSQLSARMLDVETGAILATSRPRIRNNDPILAGLTASLEQQIKAEQITEEALTHLNMGKDYYAAGVYDAAIQEFDKALAINKQLSDAYFYRGLAYYNKSDIEKAVADYNAALRIDPNYAVVYNNRGFTYYAKGDIEKAIADWTAALRINPKHDNALTSRGWWYYNRGDIEMAMMDYNAALRINPNNTTALENRAFAYHRKKDYDQAIADYEALVRLDPSNQLYRENLQFLRSEKSGRR